MDKFFVYLAKTTKTAKFKGLENLALYCNAMRVWIVQVLMMIVNTCKLEIVKLAGHTYTVKLDHITALKSGLLIWVVSVRR